MDANDISLLLQIHITKQRDATYIIKTVFNRPYIMQKVRGTINSIVDGKRLNTRVYLVYKLTAQ